MKEIYLCRGKRLDNDEWITGYYRINGVGDSMIYSEEQNISDEVFYVNPDTIGRCTGLHDKHNQLIYAGDICKIKRTIYEIVEKDGGIWAKIKKNNTTYYKLICYLCDKGLEIVGNIYDNLDILKTYEKPDL